MQEKILQLLRKKHAYVSGEELSSHLGISRQALWKHIHELKDLGYDIIAVPHLGYQLVSAPDRLLPFEVSQHLNTRFIGKKIHYFDSLPSTMDIATGLGLEGASEGTLVLAESQTKGRGRLGREWLSPKYKGIYLSLILRPRVSPAEAAIFTLLCAVSVCEAIKEYAAIDARIKWPNDIFIHKHKIGGILTEINAEADEVHFLVIGLGLNVNNDKKTLLPQVTSLKEEKKEEVLRVELLKELLRRIEINYLLFKERQSPPIIQKWRDYSLTLGRRIKVTVHKQRLEGEAVDIDQDGSLLVRKDSGIIQKVNAGDVIHCR